MRVVKSFSVGNGDMFYIRHQTDNFTMIDCYLKEENKKEIIKELKNQSKDKGISRFISTHPDEDHFGGIHFLDEEFPIHNFYVVKNKAIKEVETTSFKKYCELRDDASKAFYIKKNCSRKWMNKQGDGRGSSGINVLWPDRENEYFKEELSRCNAGEGYNNLSPIIRYSIEDGPSFMWLGDLENEFMENIEDEVELKKTTVVFAPHHGRKSGKIPNSWLEKLQPEVVVIGEAASRHLHYYTGYCKVTQNRAKDITMKCEGKKVHFYSSSEEYARERKGNNGMKNEGKQDDSFYFGTVED